MWFRRRRRTSRLVVRRAVVPAVVGSLLALSACGVPGFGPDPEDAADRLAAGLSAGDLDKVAFTDSASRASTSYAQITDDVGKAKVSVGKVSTDGDHGTATLKWSRTVGPKTWSYETEATLHKGEDAQGDQAWLVDWDPRIVEPSLKAGEKLSESTIKARRGEILGARGAAIVTPRPVLRVGIDKTGLAPAVTARSASRLAQLVDIKAEPIFLEEPGKLKLLYHIDEGKRWKVGNIFVHINGDSPHTKIQTALNRLSFRSGEIADIREIRASERRLQASGLFMADPVHGVMPKITYHIPETGNRATVMEEFADFVAAFSHHLKPLKCDGA